MKSAVVRPLVDHDLTEVAGSALQRSCPYFPPASASRRNGEPIEPLQLGCSTNVGQRQESPDTVGDGYAVRSWSAFRNVSRCPKFEDAFLGQPMPHQIFPALLFQFILLRLAQENEVMEIAVRYKLVCEIFGPGSVDLEKMTDETGSNPCPLR